MRALFCIVVAAGACVKGNPIDLTFTQNGGTYAVPGCGYSVTTLMGAEAPIPGTDVVGPDPTVRLVHLGVIGDPETSVVVQWRTNDEATLASTIRWGQGANLAPSDLDHTDNGIEFRFHGLGMAVYRQHQAHLCGLSPGTTYSYQVGGTDPTTGADHFSPVYTFHTAPDLTANPDTTVVMGFVGDSRGGYDVWTQLVSLLIARAPDVVLFSGDAVTEGITQDEWDVGFLDNAQPLFATTVVIFANGNHEDNALNYYSQFALPGDQQNFGVDWGYAHVTVANDTPADPNAITGAFHDALAADLAAHASARWKLVMHHQPMWSASTKHGSSTVLQQAWQPVFDANHVDLVLNGHDHDYEVTKPLIGTDVQTTSDNATVYVVAGGAGAELYPNGTQYWTQYSESTYSAAVIQVSRDMLELDAFRPDGTAIPTGFTKTKP